MSWHNAKFSWNPTKVCMVTDLKSTLSDLGSERVTDKTSFRHVTSRVIKIKDKGDSWVEVKEKETKHINTFIAEKSKQIMLFIHSEYDHLLYCQLCHSWHS